MYPRLFGLGTSAMPGYHGHGLGVYASIPRSVCMCASDAQAWAVCLSMQVVVKRIFVYEGRCVFAVVPTSGLFTSVHVCIGDAPMGL